jgi:hypothetical protein
VLLDATWSVSSAAGQPALTCRSIVQADTSAGYDALVDAYRRALDALALGVAAGIRTAATNAAPPADCRAGAFKRPNALSDVSRGAPDALDD